MNDFEELDRLYFLLQKVTGLLVVLGSVIIALVTGDGTGPLFCIFMQRNHSFMLDKTMRMVYNSIKIYSRL